MCVLHTCLDQNSKSSLHKSARAELQSGFAVTLSLRGSREGMLGSPQNGPGACQWAACQHTAQPPTFDVPHEDERTDGRKGQTKVSGKEGTDKNRW